MNHFCDLLELSNVYYVIKLKTGDVNTDVDTK